MATRTKLKEEEIWLSLRDPILTVTLNFFSKYEKAHNGGHTWHIFCLSHRRSKLHYLIILCVKKVVHSCVEEVKIKEFTGGPLINPPTVPFQWG